MIVAIDGTSGSGKGTIARHAADKLNFYYLDTGIYYRSVAYLAIKSNMILMNEEELVNQAENMQLLFIEDNIILNGEDVTYNLRSNEVNKIVSTVSSIKQVRYIINDLIRNYALNKNIVVDGRDIGTTVFPNAEVKIYLDADLDTRARRRFEQNNSQNIVCSYEDVLNNLKSRDEIDKNKEFGALKVDECAIIVDTTNLSVDEAITKVINIVRRKM